MSKNKGKPDSNAAISRLRYDSVVFLRIPKTLKQVVAAAAAHETIVRGHEVTINEWMIRAAIDRAGEIFGAGTAKRFYQQYFNGLAAVRTEIELPECRDKQ